MRLEKINGNQMKIFVSFEEMNELGLTKNDIGKDTVKWQHFFFSLIQKAKKEWELSLEGTIFVDVFSLQDQGIIFMLSVAEDDDMFTEDYFDLSYEQEYERKILYKFSNIEDIIQLATRLRSYHLTGDLYCFKEAYYLLMKVQEERLASIVYIIFSDYGEESLLSIPYLQEYGDLLIENNALQKLNIYFSKH
ncbi:adaptor protein MecA [Bacillus kwashiorkori]|uniref:adaptor protein MecA n=1 Tax=Bacillus kwashiorkori TaxID=1522318 RepID=UPI0007838163|nr:adaptor protein MecA [Bacillus kwashiorkori]